jgi:hypothetical protein
MADRADTECSTPIRTRATSMAENTDEPEGERQAGDAATILDRLSRREALKSRLDALNRMETKWVRVRGRIGLVYLVLVVVGVVFILKPLVPQEDFLLTLGFIGLLMWGYTELMVAYLEKRSRKTERYIIEAVLELDNEGA